LSVTFLSLCSWHRAMTGLSNTSSNSPEHGSDPVNVWDQDGRVSVTRATSLIAVPLRSGCCGAGAVRLGLGAAPDTSKDLRGDFPSPALPGSGDGGRQAVLRPSASQLAGSAVCGLPRSPRRPTR
jgi:hypothetical protein